MSRNFKEIHSDGYRIYRLMMSSPLAVKKYNQRIALYGDYRSGIIFPEQVIALNGAPVYGCVLSAQESRCTAEIRTFNEPRLISHHGSSVGTAAEVYDLELEDRMAFYFDSRKEKSYVDMHDNFFYYDALFSSKKDAMKFITKQMMNSLNKGL